MAKGCLSLYLHDSGEAGGALLLGHRAEHLVLAGHGRVGAGNQVDRYYCIGIKNRDSMQWRFSLTVVKLREREGQRVDLGKSHKGHL